MEVMAHGKLGRLLRWRAEMSSWPPLRLVLAVAGLAVEWWLLGRLALGCALMVCEEWGRVRL